MHSNPHQVDKQYYPLTRSQELLWIGQQLSPDIPLYNMVFKFEFKKPINYDNFKLAFEQTVKQNSGLRNLFSNNNPPQQWIADTLDFDFKLIEFTSCSDAIESSNTWIETQKRKNLKLIVAALRVIY